MNSGAFLLHGARRRGKIGALPDVCRPARGVGFSNGLICRIWTEKKNIRFMRRVRGDLSLICVRSFARWAFGRRRNAAAGFNFVRRFAKR